MLVCPQCQNDNPNHSLSCQQCGASLSHQDCPECGATVSFQAEKCPNCDAFTARLWWAVIAQQIPQEKPQQVPSATPVNSFFPSVGNNFPNVQSPAAIPTIEPYYLDPGQRYRLETDSNLAPEIIEQKLWFQSRVVDCQPLQKSVLKALIEQQDDLSSDTITDSSHSLWSQIGIAQLAFPYLKLSQFCPVIPEIHEAWDDGHQQVILLTERSNWQLLSELWAIEDLPILQIVYWLNEMASLWTPLSEVGCCQSLLVENNLRIDEDQSFGLVRLYQDPPDSQPTLKDLGLMWQNWLQSHQQPNREPLKPLLEKLIEGEINTVTQLCLQLEDLAQISQVIASKEVEPQFFSQISENKELAADSSEALDTVPLPSDFYAEDDQFDTGHEDETIVENIGGDDFSTADLPMELLSLNDAGYTDVGRLRRHNEDYFGVETQIAKQLSNRGQKLQAKGLYIVCDGMGGHAAGEVASALAVETLQQFFTTHWQQNELPDEQTIKKGILLANETIYQVNQDHDSYGSGRMGTTLVMALVQGTRVAIAHVGDSRIYQVNRKWGLEQLTVDHEVGQRAIGEGVDPTIAYSRPDAYQLTQALGPHDHQYIKPDIKYLELHEDTLLLLCSDGLSDNKFVETHYSSCLTPLISSSANLDEGLQKLITLANQKNGHDNITAILVRIKLQPSFEQA